MGVYLMIKIYTRFVRAIACLVVLGVCCEVDAAKRKLDDKDEKKEVVATQRSPERVQAHLGTDDDLFHTPTGLVSVVNIQPASLAASSSSFSASGTNSGRSGAEKGEESCMCLDASQVLAVPNEPMGVLPAWPCEDATRFSQMVVAPAPVPLAMWPAPLRHDSMEVADHTDSASQDSGWGKEAKQEVKVAIDTDCKKCVTGESEQELALKNPIKLYEDPLATGQEATPLWETTFLRACCVSHDGRIFVGGSAVGVFDDNVDRSAVYIWDARTGKFIQGNIDVGQFNGEVRGVLFSDDDQLLIAYADHAVDLYQRQENKEFALVDALVFGDEREKISALALSHDTKNLAIGFDGGLILTFNRASVSGRFFPSNHQFSTSFTDLERLTGAKEWVVGSDCHYTGINYFRSLIRSLVFSPNDTKLSIVYSGSSNNHGYCEWHIKNNAMADVKMPVEPVLCRSPYLADSRSYLIGNRDRFNVNYVTYRNGQKKVIVWTLDGHRVAQIVLETYQELVADPVIDGSNTLILAIKVKFDATYVQHQLIRYPLLPKNMFKALMYRQQHGKFPPFSKDDGDDDKDFGRPQGWTFARNAHRALRF
jgi:hypothetical protein